MKRPRWGPWIALHKHGQHRGRSAELGDFFSYNAGFLRAFRSRGCGARQLRAASGHGAARAILRDRSTNSCCPLRGWRTLRARRLTCRRSPRDAGLAQSGESGGAHRRTDTPPGHRADAESAGGNVNTGRCHVPLHAERDACTLGTARRRPEFFFDNATAKINSDFCAASQISGAGVVREAIAETFMTRV
jgi:hypothetical protein